MVPLFSVKTNDMMLVIYLSSVIRSVIALHNLINNKVSCFQCVQSVPITRIVFILITFMNRKILMWLQMLNKEHEKTEDSKPAAVPTAAG